MPDEHFDVAVVGAGPAGAEAAFHLERAGLRVVLFERARLPRDKPCGGGLTPKAYKAVRIPEHLVQSRIATTYLQFRGENRFSARASAASIWMVRRREFDAFLVERAVAAGAEIRDGCQVLSLERPASGGGPIRLGTQRGVVLADAVVAADGAESAVARMAGLRPPRAAAAMVALEVEGEGESSLGQTALLDYGVPRGYAWVFPKGDDFNVGLTTYDPRVARRLRPLLDRFTRASGVRFRAEPRPVGHRIPTWGPDAPLESGRVLLAGDAAGLADPFFGEGIAYALLSGRLAAAALRDSLDHGGHSGYADRLRQAVGRPRVTLGGLARVVYAHPRAALAALRFLPPTRQVALQLVIGGRLEAALWGIDQGAA